MNKDNWRRVFKFYKKPNSDLYEEGISWRNLYCTIYWWSDNYTCEAIVDELTFVKIFIDVYKDIKQWIEDIEPQYLPKNVHKYTLFKCTKAEYFDFNNLDLESCRRKLDEVYSYIDNIDSYYYVSNMWEYLSYTIKVTEVEKRRGEDLLNSIKAICIQNFASSMYTREKIEALIKDIDFSSL